MKKIGLMIAAAVMAVGLSACSQPKQGTAAQTVQETVVEAEVKASEPESAAEEGQGVSGGDSAGDWASRSIDEGKVSSMEELTFPIGEQVSGTFTGTVYLTPMIMNEEIYNFPQSNNITFAPGARSYWHSHGGMLLVGTGGVGYYQEEGKPVKIIRKGDVVECPEGVRHWHGAAADSWFSQMVIYDSHYTPEGDAPEASEVSEEEYENLEIAEYTPQVSEDNEFMFQKADTAMESETFSGPAYVSNIIGGDNVAGAPGLHYVVFDPGVINNWHTHEGGQILIATDGIGYHQIEGQPVQVLYPGDVALCPPGEKHWHGGSADTSFAHIAVNTNPELAGLEWFDRISDEEYGKLPDGKTEEDNQEDSQGKKTLVVYYSASGNTEKVADSIAQAVDGDLFELVPVKPYTEEDLNWRDDNSRVTMEHDNPDQREVELVKDTVDNWKEYNRVFIGYPIWWGEVAWPVDGFVEANDFTGKTVIPFCTSSSSGLGESGELLEKMAGTGGWQEGMRFQSHVSQEDVTSWVESLE